MAVGTGCVSSGGMAGQINNLCCCSSWTQADRRAWDWLLLVLRCHEVNQLDRCHTCEFIMHSVPRQNHACNNVCCKCNKSWKQTWLSNCDNDIPASGLVLVHSVVSQRHELKSVSSKKERYLHQNEIMSAKQSSSALTRVDWSWFSIHATELQRIKQCSVWKTSCVTLKKLHHVPPTQFRRMIKVVQQDCRCHIHSLKLLGGQPEQHPTCKSPTLLILKGNPSTTVSVLQ